MNFTSGRPGFYEEATGSRGNNISFSSSSSSSSSFQRRGFPTDCTYLHHQEGCAAAAPPPPDSSPTNNGPGGDEPADDSDDHMLYGRGEEGSNTGAVVIEREHMFDKVVTPSDVGKLNRLVIPKQHAEKYFPLDSSTNEKGLLLNFEDRTGKPWRFRYSYWNSSQSYVMTKGWSRFVKEKKLDAGDTVSFQRGVGELGKDRLFIDWRRRVPAHPPSIPTFSIPREFSFHRSPIHPWRPLFMQPPPADYPRFLEATTPNPHYRHAPIGYNSPCPPGSVVYLRSAPGGGALGSQMGMGQAERGSGLEQMLFNSVPVVQGKAAAKRLRLFGVNMDCPISESDECDILSSTTLPHPTVPLHHVPPPPFHNYSSSSSSIPRPNHGHPDEHKRKGSMPSDWDT